MASHETAPNAHPDEAGAQEAERAPKALRLLDESFEEWRHVGSAGRTRIFGTMLLAAGGLLLGSGTYAMIRIAQGEWHARAPYLLVGGLVLEVAFLLFGGSPVAAIRVGDLGVAREEDGRLHRLAWCDVRRIGLQDGTLKLDTSGGSLDVDVAKHPGAAARIVSEATRRIPKRIALTEDDRASLPRLVGGERLIAEPPQVTQAMCRASGAPLTFEKDVRMCGRCGALYHRNGVPRRCDECGRKLKAS